ncbi:MAG TPA: ABC transporter substrate-binding protein [Caldimonas sp.]|nr:ABC transporter substrate-binding protein [Caldimonas sp.]HEX4233817.1 ABC transporter substrate-binding protein [Caldimonas sp.]
MRRRLALGATVGFAASSLATFAGAQRGRKIPIVAHLDASVRSEWFAAFKHQLQDLGYVEGSTVAFETRTANGALDQLRPMAQELVRLKVDVIVTSGTAAALAAKRATTKIPIVMATGTDQVSLGLAASLAHPGGNLTGLSTITSELSAKRFELLRELLANRVTRMAVLWHTENVASMASIRDIETAAMKAAVTLQPVGVGSGDELAEAFAAMTREHAQGVIVIQSPLMYAERKKLAELALKSRLPSMFGAAEYVDAGGLASYAPSYPELYRHAAIYVDKILKGANPGDLPIEEPNAVELVVNASTARALGVTIAPVLLARVTRVSG